MKNKHNYWINGLEKGENFFMWIRSFGFAILFLFCIVTSVFFLTWLAITSRDYFNLSLLLLRLMQIGFWMFGLGFILTYACKFLRDILEDKELKVLNRESEIIRKKIK